MVADVIDSSSQPPYMVADCFMDTIAKEVLRPFGVTPVFKSGRGAYFSTFEWKESEEVGGVLTKIAAQSGMLVNADELGDPVFEIPDIKAPSVGTLSAADPACPVTNWSGTFNGRARFSLYTVLGVSGSGSSVWDTVRDTSVPSARRLTFTAENVSAGGVKHSAHWRKSKQVAEAIDISLPVAGWLNPSGTPWWPGQIVVVDSETLELPKRRCLIQSVELAMSADSKTANLKIVPPESLTGGEVPEDW